MHVFLIAAEPNDLAKAASLLTETTAILIRPYVAVLPWPTSITELRHQLIEADPHLRSAVIAELNGGDFSS